MDAARAIEIYYGILLLSLGVSFFTATHQWKKLITYWLEYPEQYVLLAFILLPLGIFTILLHNIWLGLGVIVTVFGWLISIKAVVVLCFPSLVHRLTTTLLVKKKLLNILSIIYGIMGALVLISSVLTH